MTRKTYCGNLLWQSGLTLFALKPFARMTCQAVALRRLILVSFLALAGNGCVYTSSGGAPDFDRCGGRENVFLAPTWDDSDKAFRLDFSAYSYYQRSGVYPPGTKLTPGGAHWGDVGDIIEGLAHLPTFWLERALSADRSTDYDVVFLDRNSTRGKITLMTFPEHRYDDRLLRQEPFRRYWTNEVFGIDFAEGERALAENRPGIAASNKRMAYRDKLADAQPVLWWKDESGIEHLLVFQCLRNPPEVRDSLGGGYCVGTPREYKLLYFRDFGFVRAFDFEKKKERWLYTSQFDFSTMDGRFVNIGFNGHPVGDCCDWIFCQIDLETGDIRKVGSYTALDKSEVNGGLEIRTTVRPER